jgi:hypothetical protein
VKFIHVPVNSRDELLQQRMTYDETWKGTRTQRINLPRGILREAGYRNPGVHRRLCRYHS